MTRITKRQRAVMLFNKWREDDYALRITMDQAFILTNGVVGEAGSDEIVSLSAVAVRYSARKDK